MIFRLIIIYFIASQMYGCEQSPQGTPPKHFPLDQEPDQEPTETNQSSLLEEDELSVEARIEKFIATPPKDDTRITYKGYQSIKPPAWFWTPPKSQVVSVNYVVPSIDENEHAIFSVTNFNKGEGGHFTENVTRWKSLFRSNDGAPVKPTFEVLTVNGHDAVLAEFQGEYMGAGAAWHLKNHSLLVAEVREPEGNIYFKLLGPSSTVNAHRPHFINVLNSMQPIPPTP